MGLRQLSCYRSPDPRILSRLRRIWSRGGRTRRPDVGRGLSPQPETQHPPVGGEVLIGLVASRLRRPDQTPSGSVGVGHDHNPHGATDQPARRAKPSAPRSDDRGSKPSPTVPDRSREVKVHYGRAEFATFGGGGVDRRRRGGIQSRARPSPPAPRACCVASRAADRRSASCRHLRACRSIPPASLRARLATLDTPDDPARSARASARGASGARAAASNHWRLQLQQRAAARSIDLMGAG